MPVWTQIPKHSGSSTNTEGSSIGLLLLFTYAATITAVTDIWSDLTKPTTSYTPINELGIAILTEDSHEILAEDGARLIMEEQFPTSWDNIPKPV